MKNWDEKNTYFFDDKSNIEDAKKFFDNNTEFLFKVFIKFDETLINNFDYFSILEEVNYKHLSFSLASNVPFNNSYLTDRNYNLISFICHNGKIKFDFENFKNLEELNFEHTKGTINYNKLTKLKHLRLNKYDQKDLTTFSMLSQLETLILSQGKVEDINAIQNLKNLKTLWLCYFKNLRLSPDLRFSSIEELDLTSCPNIDLAILPRVFPNLKKLTLANYKDIKTLKTFFENLKSLKSFNFAECKLLESDNRYWKDYPNVKINFMNQKNFILKRKDFDLI